MTMKMMITVQIVTSLLIASLVSTSPVINTSDQQPSSNSDKSEVKNVDGASFTKYNYDDSEEIGYQFTKREASESTGPLDQPLVWGARIEKPVEAPVQVDVKPGQKIEWALNLNDKKFYSNNDGLDGIEQKKEDSSAPEATKTSPESYDPIKGILPAVLTDKRRLGEDDKTTSDSVASSPSKVSPVKGEAHRPLVKTVVKAYVPAKNVPQHVFTDDQFPAVIKIKGRQYLVIPHQADSSPSTSYLSATSPWHLNLPGQVSALYGAPGQGSQQHSQSVPSFPFYPSFGSSPTTVKVHPQAAPVAQTVFGGYPVGGHQAPTGQNVVPGYPVQSHQAPVAPNFGVYRPVQSSIPVAQSVESVQQSSVQSAAPGVPVDGQQQAVVGQVSTGQTVGVVDQAPSVQSVPLFPGSQVFGQSPFAVQSAPGQSFGLVGKYPSAQPAATPSVQPFAGQYPSFQPAQTFQSPSAQGFAQDYAPVQPFAQNFGQYSYPQYPGPSNFGQRFVFVVPGQQPGQQSIPTVTSVSSPPSFGMMGGQSSIPSSWGMHEQQPVISSSWGMHDQPSKPSSIPSSVPSSWGMHDQPAVSSSWGMNEPATKPSSVSPSSEATKNDESAQSAAHSSSWGMTGEASKPSKPSKVSPVSSASDSKDQVVLGADGVKGGVQSAPSVSAGVSTGQTIAEDQKVQQGQVFVAAPVDQGTKGQSAPMVPSNVGYQPNQSPYLIPTVSSFTVQQQQPSSSPSFSPSAGYQQSYQVVQPGQLAPNTFQGYQSSYQTPYQSTHQTPLQSNYQAPFQTSYQTPYQSYYPQTYNRLVSLPAYQNGLNFVPTTSYNTYTVHTKYQ